MSAGVTRHRAPQIRGPAPMQHPTSRTREEHLAWASWLVDRIDAPLDLNEQEEQTLRTAIEVHGWSFGEGLTSWRRFVEAWEVGIEHTHDILRVHEVPWEDPWAALVDGD